MQMTAALVLSGTLGLAGTSRIDWSSTQTLASSHVTLTFSPLIGRESKVSVWTRRRRRRRRKVVVVVVVVVVVEDHTILILLIYSLTPFSLPNSGNSNSTQHTHSSYLFSNAILPSPPEQRYIYPCRLQMRAVRVMLL